MKFNILASTSQINSRNGKCLGIGSVNGLAELGRRMKGCGIAGDIYDLPNGSRNPGIASPFSLTSGFALTTDELNFFDIEELKADKTLLKHVSSIQDTYCNLFGEGRTVSYTLKRSLVQWILTECFQRFSDAGEQRRAEYKDFERIADYWLDDYALFETYREKEILREDKDYRDKSSSLAKRFIEKQKERIQFHKYVQFLCFQQRLGAYRELKKGGTGLIVNLPFGVEFDSADVFFHPEVFDENRQVGCSPEPEHGYPEQAWGVAVYKEKSAGLETYLKEKMQWLSNMGDGIFLDHLVGWCGQYVLPREIPEESRYPHGHFLTENHEKRKETIRWFLNIINQTGLRMRGEVAGDAARVKATREVIREMIEEGVNISAMAIPRWESRKNILMPLKDYSPGTITMVETHDTSTLLQYLLNRKGYFEDFETAGRILEFCRTVLALPFFENDVPLVLDECSDDLWFEISKRICNGTPSVDFVFTLPGLISLLDRQHRSPTIENNINVKPGTSGAVGNGWRNWSHFSPPVEVMTDDPDLKRKLQELGKRSFQPIEPFYVLDRKPLYEGELTVIYSPVTNRRIVYRSVRKQWKILDFPGLLDGNREVSELLVKNEEEEEVWNRIDLESLIDLTLPGQLQFQDLNGNRECYSYSVDELRENGLFVKLQPDQIHHFLVYRGDVPVMPDFPD